MCNALGQCPACCKHFINAVVCRAQGEELPEVGFEPVLVLLSLYGLEHVFQCSPGFYVLFQHRTVMPQVECGLLIPKCPLPPAPQPPTPHPPRE